jgi:putative sigma-54 modulation protein
METPIKKRSVFMEIIIAGRHVEVTEGMKTHLLDRLESIVSDVPVKITSVRAVLDVERSRHKAEIIIHMKGHEIEATETTYDMYASIDGCCEKVERQLKKYIDKMQSHKSSLKDMELAKANAKNEIDYELDKLEELVEDIV